MTYKEARAEAQHRANQTGYDYGVEHDAFGYHAFALPRRENRYGHELRCEVVHCEVLSRCAKGHGPNA